LNNLLKNIGIWLVIALVVLLVSVLLARSFTRPLAALKSLVWLNLHETPVTDAGLKGLAGLTSLKALFLSATEVSDVGLKELAALKNLRILHLQYTDVTDAGVAELQKALPNCKIER
jgi:Leucine-rich repeat (LRR) protein